MLRMAGFIAGAMIALFLLAVFTLLPGMMEIPEPVPTVHGRLPQDVYVWQRSWTPEVSRAVGELGGNFRRIIYLGAEIRWEQGRAEIVHVPPDCKKLAGAGASVGVAVRIGTCPGRVSSPENISRITAVVRGTVNEAGSSGLNLCELQIDYDCAEPKLSDYAELVKHLRQNLPSHPPLKIVITALPCWLDCREFGSLAKAADEFVLQVHSFEPPRRQAGEWTLCDPAAARSAVMKAARFARPFRVALPTYGYLAAFDDSGRLLGIRAEGQTPNFPRSAVVRRISADAAELAGLVRQWTDSRPAAMQGIIWYRMPVETDEMNWRWVTLREVMAGRRPAAELSLEITRPQPMLAEISLANTGSADSPPPAGIKIEWSDARAVASDALGGFAAGERSETSYSFEPSEKLRNNIGVIKPGGRVAVGWIRFDKDTEIRGNVIQQK